jgi:hypothetical protein
MVYEILTHGITEFGPMQSVDVRYVKDYRFGFWDGMMVGTTDADYWASRVLRG